MFMVDYNDISFKPNKEGFKPEITGDKKQVPNITLYMDKDIQLLLKETARKENRSISRQVIHMFEYYLEHTKEPK